MLVMLEAEGVKKENKRIILRGNREGDSLKRGASLSSRCRFIHDAELPAVCFPSSAQGACTLCLFSVNKQDYTK